MSSWYLKKPDILEQFDTSRHAVIEASAGTGKTFTLEHLVLEYLIETRCEPEELLLLTFTEKAAEEIKSRVRKRLTLALNPDEAAFRPENFLDTPHWVITEEVAQHLRHVLSSLDACQISTIHSFCTHLQRTMPIETGSREGLRLLDRDEIAALAYRECVLRGFTTHEPARSMFELALSSATLDEIRDRIIQGKKAEEFRKGLSKHELEQYAKATLELYRSVRWADLAAAAAGHTHAKKDQRGIDAVANLPSLEPQLPQAPIEALFALHAHGLFDVPSLITTGKGTPYSGGPEIFGETLERFETLANAFGVGSVNELPLKVLTPIYSETERQIRENRALTDYDEMIASIAGAMNETDSQLRAALVKRFRYVLIDEFQDTSALQWSLFRRLLPDAGEISADPDESSGFPRLVIVGDPKQAIYRFRNADVATYLAARDELLGEHDAQRLPLLTNYRSNPELVAAYNTLFLSSDAPVLSGPDIVYDEPVKAGCSRGDIDIIGGDFDAGERAKINVLEIDVSDVEGKKDAHLALAHRIHAHEIHRLLNSGVEIHEAGKSRPLRPRDIMVLGRGRKQLTGISWWLRAYGVPHAYYKAGSVFASPQAMDLLHVLRAIAQPNRRDLVARALLTPFFDLLPSEALAVLDEDGSSRVRNRIRSWADLAESRDYSTLFFKLLYESGLAARLELSEDTQRDWLNFEHLTELMQGVLLESMIPISELVEWLTASIANKSSSEQDDEQRLDPDENAVRLLTLHSAKGLEAPVVFVLGKYERRWGNDTTNKLFDVQDGDQAVKRFGFQLSNVEKQLISKADYADEERLAYVGATRPQAALYFAALVERASTEKGDSELDDTPSGDFSEQFELKYGASGPPVGSTKSSDALGVLCRSAMSIKSAKEPGIRFVSFDGQRPPFVPRPPETSFFADLPLPSEREIEAALTPRPEWSGEDSLFHSYSSLKNAIGKRRMTGFADEESERAMEIDLPSLRAMSRERLPPGVDTGSCLHDILEHIDEKALLSVPDADTFADSELQDDVVRRHRERYGLGDRYHRTCREIAWYAYRRPLACALDENVHLELPDGLAATDCRPELEFLIPRKALDPSLQDLRSSGFEISADYLFGFIDLTFAHDGRYYVLDWKTDNTGIFDQDTMREHVEEHYGVQARMYSIALMQMLGISIEDEGAYEERFGGFLYSFLRGIHETDAVYANRYPLSELRDFMDRFGERAKRARNMRRYAQRNTKGAIR